ncbi:uncharacterized protein LOC132063190 [Lycium ferocissimum]|uniref:uncharacterized protein LOC132063190 n=1 Tax=Lycium ferocissimum TaxID=112874 RepID=UPI002814C44E|nr:uncharacterized protein LOC132063190 [Lycium ferocissimum]
MNQNQQNQRAEENYASAIVHPRCGAASVKIDSSLYQLLKLEGYFRNSIENDPQRHLQNFVDVCTNHIQNNIPQDAIRLRLFNYSLTGDARAWFKKLPRNSITTWAEMAAVFLKKWYPPNKKAEIRDKIYEFKQQPGEQLYEAWERFKEYLQKISNHSFPENILMEKFYRGLDPVKQSVANNAADGCFMNKSYRRVTNILDRLTTPNQAWHSNNADIVPYGSTMIQNMVKKNLDTQQTLAKLATNISLLTKKFDETQIKKVNVCEDDVGMPKGMYQTQEGPFHEGLPMQIENANYVNNSQGGYQRQNYQGSYQNQNQWRPQQGQGAYNNNNSGNYNNNYGGANQGIYNNSNNFGNKIFNPYIPPKGKLTEQGSSRVEAMLEKVLANQSKFERTLSGLTETVGSHIEAIQKLKSQMRDISREQHPPKKGGLPSD